MEARDLFETKMEIANTEPDAKQMMDNSLNKGFFQNRNKEEIQTYLTFR